MGSINIPGSANPSNYYYCSSTLTSDHVMGCRVPSLFPWTI